MSLSNWFFGSKNKLARKRKSDATRRKTLGQAMEKLEDRSMMAVAFTENFQTYTGAGFQPTPTAGQLSSNNWAATGWSDGALAFGGTQTTASTDYTRGVAANGGVTTGGFYAFTLSSGTNTIFGIQPGGSDWAPGTLTLRLQNDSVAATNLSVSYDLWVNNDQARSNSLNFLTSLDNTTYTGVSAFNYTSTAAADALGFTKVATQSTTLNLSIPASSFIYLRWSGADVGGTGSRDEFGIDNISVSAFTTPTVTASAATSIGTTTATLNGNVTSDGGSAITERGFVYSTTDNTPTIAESATKTIVSGTTGAYTLTPTTLTAGTTYYVAAYAFNAATGNTVPVYSSTQTFTTNAASIAPAITTPPGNQSIVAGNNASFTAAASGTPTPTVQWQESTNGGTSWNNVTNGGVYSGATTNTLTITAATVGMTNYQYRAVYTNGVAPDATTSAATLTVAAANVAPSVTSQPTSQAIANGANASFTAAASGTPTPTVQWQESINNGGSWNNITNGGVYSGATSGTLTITGATLSMSTYQYRAVFTNVAGNATSNAAVLTVSAVAPSVLTSPSNQTISFGANASFTATASGNPTPTIQWQENAGSGFANITDGGVYSGATTGTLTLTSPTVSMSTYQYRAVFTNAGGSANSTAATLTVNAVLATVTASAPTSVTNTTATFNGNVTNNGGATTVTRGFVYSTTDTTPTIAEGATQVAGGTGTGAYTGNATGLTANTTYYVAAFATNSAGTSYSTTQTFSTNGNPFGAGNISFVLSDESDSNSPLSIGEINSTSTAQSAIQTISIPSTGSNALRISASGTSTAYLTRSNDGSLLSFTAVNTLDTTSNVNSIATRGVGTLSQAAAFNLATTYTASTSGGTQTRGATSLDNTTWYIGDQTGIHTNNSSATPNPSGNFRAIKSFDGKFYVAQASSTAGVTTVSEFVPGTTGTVTGLTGLGNNSAFQDFYFVTSGESGVDNDVLYGLAATSNTVGTILKFSLVSGSWVANGTYSTGAGGFGLVARDNANGADLYYSTGQGALTANSVVKLLDSAGYNTAINITSSSTLYTAPSGRIVKGLSFAPDTAPTDIALSNATVTAGSGAISIGTLSSTDSSASDAHTYALTDGTGSTNNGLFSVSGNTLSSNVAGLAAGTYSVRVRTMDKGGLAFEKAFSITVNAPPPGITVTPTSGLTTAETGTTATFTVVLNTQPTGNVVIPVSTSNGAEGKVSTTGSPTPANSLNLTFTTANWNVPQTVTVTGQDDLLTDGNIAYTIVLGNPTSTDAGYAAIDPADVSVTNIDDDVPRVLSINRKTPTGTNPTNATSLVYTVTFDQGVTGVDATDFSVVKTGTANANATVSVAAVSGSVYDVTVSGVTGNGTVGLNVVDDDSIASSVTSTVKLGGTGTGNGNFTGQTFTIDNAAPTVTVNQKAGQADPTSASPIQFTVAFNEAVDATSFTPSDLSFTGSTVTGTLVAAITPVDAQTFTVDVTGMTSNGNVVLSLPAGSVNDLAGNSNTVSTSTDNTVALVLGYIPYTTAGVAYNQNFDSLPNTGTFSFTGNGPHHIGVSPIGATGASGWYFSKTSGTDLNAAFYQDTGSSGNDGAYSYGSAASTDRAFGSQAGSNVTSRLGAIFQNDSGSTLNSITFAYTGEQWRDGGGLAPSTLAFSYAFGGTSIDSGSFVNATALDFTSLVTANTPAGIALDGNLPANQSAKTFTLNGVNWAPGQKLVIRWNDTDDSGPDDGLAIDNFSLVAATSANSAPVFTSVNNTYMTQSATSTFQVTTSAVPAPTYSLAGAPAWVSINSSTGLITATTPAVTALSNVAFDITATNSQGSATQTFTINVIPSTISYAVPNSNYTQNFDSLPATGSNQFATGFVDLANAAIGAYGAYGWQIAEPSNAVKFFADNGSGNTGSLNSYGSFGSTDRALGSIASGSQIGRLGAVITNNSSVTLENFTLSYTGEQWRKGDTAANDLKFEYLVGTGTNIIATGTFTTVTGLKLTSPNTTATNNTAIDGNAAGNKVAVTGTVNGLTWAPGQTLIIRWSDTNDTGGGGADDGLAIDDVTFSAGPFVPVAPVFTSANSTNVQEGKAINFTVTASGAPAATFTTSTLPSWLSFTAGVFSGTAPSVISDTAIPITITATNSAGSVTQNFTVNVLNSEINFTGLYTQNFDTLPTTSPGTLTGQGPIALIDSPISASGMIGWSLLDTSPTSPAKFDVSSGTNNSGNTFSNGSTTAPSDRALGSLASSQEIPAFGAVFINSTGQTVTDFKLTYTGEQWRNGGSNNKNTLTFGYQFGGADIKAGPFLPQTALDFASLQTSTTAGALDGNSAANRAAKTFTFTGVSWAPNTTLVIRWADADDTGSDDNLAIDDLQLVVVGAPVVTSSGPTLSYTENAGAVAVDGNINVADGDSTNLASATVTFSGLVGAEDTITYSTAGTTITGNLAGNVLTFTGSDTVANYQTVLRSVKYANSSESPTTTNRTAVIVANDGALTSVAVTRTISVTSVNDLPTLVNNTGIFISSSGIDNIDNTQLKFTDLDNTASQLTYTITGLDLSYARFERNGAGGAAITSFKQSEIDSGVIRFVRTGTPRAASIPFTVSDGTNTVGPFNFLVKDSAVPTITGPSTATVVEDTALVFNGGAVGSFTFSNDPTTPNEVITVDISTSRGAVTLSSLSGLTFTTGDGTADSTMSFTGKESNIDAALAGLSYLSPTSGSDQLVITVTDPSNPTLLTTSHTVTIAVTDNGTNDPPVFVGGPNRLFTTSEWKKEQLVGRVASPFVTVQALDDIGSSLTYSFKLDDTTDVPVTGTPQLAIDNSGNITFVNDAGDFENPTDLGGDNIYEAWVRVSDGTNFAYQIVSITVTNAAEKAYVVTTNTDLVRLETFKGDLVESEAIETDKTNPPATNPSTYENPTNTDVTRFNGRLEIRVRDDDNENVPGSNDANPAIPATVQETLSFQIVGGADAALFDISTATGVSTTDNDGVAGLTYSPANNQFGVLTFKGSFAGADNDDPIDADGDGKFEVIVQVNDGQTSTQFPFTIQIIKQDDNSPVFTATDANRTLVENTTITIDSAAGGNNVIDASDADTQFTGGTAETLTYSIVNSTTDPASVDFNAFNINASTGQLTFKVAPDYDVPGDLVTVDNKYVVVVQVDDGVARSPATTMTVTVTVTPESDNDPVITSTNTISTPENQTFVQVVSATDADLPAQTITWSVMDSEFDGAKFTIAKNTTTGNFELKWKGTFTPNFESPSNVGSTPNQYVVVIKASDGTNGNLGTNASLPDARNRPIDGMTFQTVTVNVTDVNDAPVITSFGSGDFGAISMQENKTAVTTVTAKNEEGASRLRYLLPTLTAGSSINLGGVSYVVQAGDVSDSSKFSISNFGGVLTWKSAPDFEGQASFDGDQTYRVIVQVVDNNNATPASSGPEGSTLSDYQVIDVTVTNTGTVSMQLKEVDVTVGTTTKKQLVLEDIVSGNDTLQVTRAGTNLVFSLPLNTGDPDSQIGILGTITGTFLGGATTAKVVMGTVSPTQFTLSIGASNSVSVSPAATAALTAASLADAFNAATGPFDNFIASSSSDTVILTPINLAGTTAIITSNVSGGTGAKLSVVRTSNRMLFVPEAAIVTRGTNFVIDTKNGDDTVILGESRVGNNNNDVIPSTALLSINLGGGVDTLDLQDASNNKTANTWDLTGAGGGKLTIGAFGSLTFSAAENLKGGSGVDTFNFTYAGGPSNLLTIDGDTGSSLDSVNVTRNADFTLADASLAISDLTTPANSQTFALANIGRAFLTSNNAALNTFNLNGWTKQGDGTAVNSYGGKITVSTTAGATGNDRLIKSGDFTNSATANVITNTLLTTGDGMKIGLSAVKFVTLTDTGSADTTFDVTGFTQVGANANTAALTINGGTSTGDTIKFVNSGFSVMETKVDLLTMNQKYSVATPGFEKLNVTGSAAAQKVLVYSETSFTDQTLNAGPTGGGEDIIAFNDGGLVANSNATKFTISPSSYALDANADGDTVDTADRVGTISGFERFVYDGTGGNNEVTINGWTGNGDIRGQNGTGDKVFLTSADANLALRQQSIAIGPAGTAKVVTLTGVEDAEITGTSASQAFEVNNWKGTATINGVGGTDSLTVFQDTDFLLDDAAGGKTVLTVTTVPKVGSTASVRKDLTFSNMTNVTLSSAGLNNQYSLNEGFDANIPGTLTLKPGGGTDTLRLGVDTEVANDFKAATWTSAAGYNDGGLEVTQSAAPVTTPSTIKIGKSAGAATRTLSFATTTDLFDRFLVKSGAGAFDYKFTDYTGGVGSILDVGAGTDKFIVSNSVSSIASMSLTTNDGTTTAKANKVLVGSNSFALAGIDQVQLTGGASAQAFTVDNTVASTELTGTTAVTLDGGAGNDTLKLITPSTAITVNNNGFVTTSALDVNIANTSFERAEINGGSANQTLTIGSTWTGSGSFNGGAGTDRLVLNGRDTDITLTNGSLVYGTTTKTTIGLVQVEGVTLDNTSGTGHNFIDASAFSGSSGVSITGGSGNDIIFGSLGNDVINGGNGDNWVGGGAGNDMLTTGSGKDVVVGGLGVDTINSGTGSDIVIGGRTAWDDTKTAAAAIRDFWATSPKSYGTIDSTTPGLPRPATDTNSRIADLWRSNTNKLSVSHPKEALTTTVFDDAAADSLTGGGADALDWYFANLSGGTLDTVVDSGAGELVTEV